MEAAGAMVAIPLALVPALDTMIKALKEMDSKAQVAKWTESADQMLRLVHMVAQHVPVDALRNFLDLCSK